MTPPDEIQALVERLRAWAKYSLSQDRARDLGEAAAALERLSRENAELERQRLMVLAAVYKEAPRFVATICDENLDRSGALLGRVRDLHSAVFKEQSNG